MVEGVDVGVTVQDADGRLVYANDRAAHVLGYPSGEALCGAYGADTVAQFDLYFDDGSPMPLGAIPSRLALLGRSTEEVGVRFRKRGETKERRSMGPPDSGA
jgi:PAS domain-containing protein